MSDLRPETNLCTKKKLINAAMTAQNILYSDCLCAEETVSI